MSKLKEAVEGAFNWAGFSLISIALLSIAAPVIGPTLLPVGALAISAVNLLINTVINPINSAIIASAGFIGAIGGFFKKKK